MQIDSLVNLYLSEHIRIAQSISTIDIVKLAEAIIKTERWGCVVFTMGNGGGASIASHFASDLSIHPFVSEDKKSGDEGYRLEVHCLNDSPDILTRIANDMGFEGIFVEQMHNYVMMEGDIVIAFSTSGNSPNIIKALEYAKSRRATTVLIGGHEGGKAKDIVDISILIPGTSNFPGQTGANNNCFHIEDFQSSVAHMITGLLKEAIRNGSK